MKKSVVLAALNMLMVFAMLAGFGSSSGGNGTDAPDTTVPTVSSTFPTDGATVELGDVGGDGHISIRKSFWGLWSQN
jgi:hypothetical protein